MVQEFLILKVYSLFNIGDCTAPNHSVLRFLLQEVTPNHRIKTTE